MPRFAMTISRLLFLQLVFFLLLSSRVHAVTIVAIGDSTTENNFKTVPAYPQLLALDLPQWTVINAGKSGDTTAGGLARLNSIIAFNPQVVVVQYGANDSFWEFGRSGPYVTVPDYVANLTAMVNALKAANITPVLMTPDPFLLPPSNINYGPYATQTPDQFLQLYADAVRALAPQLNVPLVDAYAALAAAVGDLGVSSSPYYYDYRHPTTLGEAVVKAELEPLLAALVPEPSSIAIAGMSLLALTLVALRYRR